MRRPLRKVGAFTRLQMRHNDQSMAMFISRCDERAFDMPRAGRQNLSTFKLVAPILADQAKILRTSFLPGPQGRRAKSARAGRNEGRGQSH